MEKIRYSFTSSSQIRLFTPKFRHLCPLQVHWTAHISHDYSFWCHIKVTNPPLSLFQGVLDVWLRKLGILLLPGPKIAYLPPNFTIFVLYRCIGWLIYATTVHLMSNQTYLSISIIIWGYTERLIEKIRYSFTFLSQNRQFTPKFQHFCPRQVQWTACISQDCSF